MPKHQARGRWPHLDPARRARIEKSLGALLRARKIDASKAPSIADHLDKWAAAYARRPGEQYKGPQLLVAEVRRAARRLRDSLADVIRQRHIEQAIDEDFSGFLF